MSWEERQYSKSIGAYLTKEVDTKQQWIDGKPIYRKVFDFGALPNATTKSTAHGFGTYTLITLKGVASNGTTRIPIPFSNTAGTTVVSIESNATNIVVGTSVDLTSYTSSYLIAEYTK